MQTPITKLKMNRLIEEEELICSAKQDIKKFSILYSRYYEQIFRYIYQRLGSENDSYDICSQVFLIAMQRINSYENRGFLFSSWLYTIARNEVNQYYRKKKYDRVVNVYSNDILQIVDDNECNSKEYLMEKLKYALESLSDFDLDLIEMRYFEHRSYNEIMQIVDISVNNLKVRVSRILKRLKKQFV